MLRIDERLKERTFRDYSQAKRVVALIEQVTPMISEQAVKTLPQAKEALKRVREALSEAEQFVNESASIMAAMSGHMEEGQLEAVEFQDQLADTVSMAGNLEVYLQSHPETVQRVLELAEEDALKAALTRLTRERLASLAGAIEVVHQARFNIEPVQGGVEAIWEGDDD